MKEEELDPEKEKLKETIEKYVYSGRKALIDPDVIELVTHPVGILKMKATRDRLMDKVVDFVKTFIPGMAG